MAWPYARLVLTVLLNVIVSVPSFTQSPQEPPTTTSRIPAAVHPNTSEGLQSLVEETLRAAKSQDSAKEGELIRGLLVPEDSNWFTDEFGPGFGARLSAAYRRSAEDMEQELRTVFEGDVQRGWTKPNVLRFDDAETSEFPIDKILNCMNEVVPLYQTAVNGSRTASLMTSGPNQRVRVVAGDPSGYFVFVDGAFRFIPLEILIKLPRGRPVRIKLDMDAMDSKIANKVSPPIPGEAIRRHISGKVVIELILSVEGKIKESKVLEGDPILSNSALNTVNQWRFEPTKLDGDPVEVDFQIPFIFEVH